MMADFQGLWNNKKCNRPIMGTPEGKQERKEWGQIPETVVAESSPELLSDTKSQTQETQGTPSTMNAKNTRLRYMIFKSQKIKDNKKILNEARGKKYLMEERR